MTSADSAPGVSGGAIVFPLGFYDKFIGSLDALISDNMQQKKKAVIFSLKPEISWIVGFLMMVSVLASIFYIQIYTISFPFMGFILFAIPIVTWEEKKNMRLSAASMMALLIDIAVVALITYFNPVADSGSSANLTQLDVGLIIYVFTSAMSAISTMVLPGISGSTLLLIFGLYVSIISAIKVLMGFDFSYVSILFVFGLGITTGAITAVHLIKFALDKRRSIMVFLITGTMSGSFYAVIVGSQTLETLQAPLSLKTFETLQFIIDSAIIFGLQKVRDISEK